MLGKLVDWLSKVFSYKGIAWLLAAFKYTTLSPSDEEIECMIPLAKKITSLIYKSLVIAFIAKIVVSIAMVCMASPPLSPVAILSWKGFILPVIFKMTAAKSASVGVGKVMMSSLSAIGKGKDAKKYGNQAKEKALKQEEEYKKEEKESLSSWSVLWNHCEEKLTSSDKIGVSGEKREKISGEKMLDLSKAIATAVRGWGTNEKLLFKALTQLSKSSDKVKQTTKTYYKAKYGEELIDAVKGDLSGKDLEKALNLLK